MIRFAKNILPFIFLAVLAGCSEEKMNPEIAKDISGREMPTAEGWNSILSFYTENGRLTTVLHYEHATDYGDQRVKLLHNIKVDFYDSTQKAATWLTADSGRVVDEKEMHAIGNVIAVNDSGRTLKTEELVWRTKTQKITTDKFVTITSPKEDLQGYGFESDQNIRNWVIFKPVLKTIVNEENKKK